ncbi:MAG TPA: BlaI/MecI/CopY family transcriptional regulator [Terriglobales bacterium]|jgi:predicted transcriptional regulator|nr:BlaI/MecI/CopY family transcriptional regulator [Terriglobales bacterium]
MNKVFRIFGFASGPSLGPLEQQLLESLWARGSATVRELVDAGTIQLAYTTIMTTLDRLYKKGLLSRVPEGRAFRYVPLQSREELQRTAAVEGIRDLLTSQQSSTLPLSYLVEAISRHDAELLDDLQRLVEQKRSQLRNQETD